MPKGSPALGRRIVLAVIAFAMIATPVGAGVDAPTDHLLALDAEAVRALAGEQAPDSFAGTFLEDGRVVVMFSGDAEEHKTALRSRMRYPEKLTLRSARYTLAELNATQAAISQRFEALKSKGVTMYVLGVLEPRNVVRVVVNRLDNAARAEFREYGSKVVLEEGSAPQLSSRANDPPPFTAGYELRNVSEDLTFYACTQAFAMKSYDFPARYFVTTAGHCFDSGHIVHHGPYPVGRAMWLDGFYWGSNADVIPIEVSYATTAPWVIDDYPDVLDVVTASSSQVIGAGKCKSGRTTDRTCGAVTATGQEVYYVDWEVRLFNQVFASMWNDYGDSGAPVYHHVESNVSAAADGILSGFWQQPDGTRLTIYSDIQRVRDLTGFAVATVSNY